MYLARYLVHWHAFQAFHQLSSPTPYYFLFSTGFFIHDCFFTSSTTNLVFVIILFCFRSKFLDMDKVRKLFLTTWRPVLQGKIVYFHWLAHEPIWFNWFLKLPWKVTRMCCDAKVKNLVAFPDVNIGEGKLKYILAKVYVHGEMGQSKTVIRGVSRVKYHREC